MHVNDYWIDCLTSPTNYYYVQIILFVERKEGNSRRTAMSYASYYEILGIERNATLEDIKKA